MSQWQGVLRSFTATSGTFLRFGFSDFCPSLYNCWSPITAHYQQHQKVMPPLITLMVFIVIDIQ